MKSLKIAAYWLSETGDTESNSKCAVYGGFVIALRVNHKI